MKNTFHIVLLFGGVLLSLLAGVALGLLCQSVILDLPPMGWFWKFLAFIGMLLLFGGVFPAGSAAILWDVVALPLAERHAEHLFEKGNNSAPNHADVLRILWGVAAMVGELGALTAWGDYGGWASVPFGLMAFVLLGCLSFFAHAFWKER